jgi:6-phosphogluconolactonase
MRVTLSLLFLVVTNFLTAQSYYLFVGTYTDSGSKGIYVYEFNSTSGKARWLSNTENIINPSFLVIAPNKKIIYAATETALKNAGSISAFAFDRTTGKLTFVNKQPSGGDNPAYVTINKNNKWVFCGNYTGGSLSALKINSDGSLQPLNQNIKHSGNSIDKLRQEKPHVHSTVFSPDEKYLFVPDLGIDKVMTYKFTATSAKPLQPAKRPFIAVEPGSGPRHLTFHANGKWAYLVGEISGTVDAFTYKKGTLTFKQRIATHPPGFQGAIGSADIHISPDGNFLYTSNRGDENTITIFAVDANTGLLTLKGFQPTLGIKPRNFTIDPSGNFLLVANQDTNNIVVFKRDRQTGLLRVTGEQIKVPTPVCLQMMEKD